jgi:RimJ/RimL family protein N-acetyltransferase
MSMNFTTKHLSSEDWQLFRNIRLEALKTEPGVYAASYDEMKDMEDDFWIDRLADSNWAYFGLYDGDKLVGLSGIMRNVDDRDEAELIASYIRKEYRGKGLSKLFYAARIEWARAKGIKKLIISHRESNTASRQANQNFGFRFTHSVPRLWHDGLWEENVYYELIL